VATCAHPLFTGSKSFTMKFGNFNNLRPYKIINKNAYYGVSKIESKRMEKLKIKYGGYKNIPEGNKVKIHSLEFMPDTPGSYTFSTTPTMDREMNELEAAYTVGDN
jgi:hypothetical protein